jgi:hypothetical protein
MLERGDAVPHFEVKNLQGQLISYSEVWQHRNLVLITLRDDDSDSTRRYLTDLTNRIPEFSNQNTTCIITRDEVPGVPAPAVVVADKWGEIIYIAAKPDVGDLPMPQELLDWIDYVQTRCPECEGEAR